MASIAQSIVEIAGRYGVDPDLALAVARKESGLSQAARGSAGEIGVFQLMPSTAKDLGVNASDLTQNIEGGVKYLRQLLDRYDGNAELALAAYNGGMGNVDRGTVSSAAWSYARSILASIGLTDTPIDAGSDFTFPTTYEIPTGVIVAAGVAFLALLWVVTEL